MLAVLDAANTRSTAALEPALARRAEVVAERDRQVAAAQEAVERVVAERRTTFR